MSREMLNGRSEQSQLIGVRLQTNGKSYYAFRAEDYRYYDSEGNGLERGFYVSQRQNNLEFLPNLTHVV